MAARRIQILLALGTILVAYLGQTIGWGWGFGLAGIGMLAGLVVFVLGKSVLYNILVDQLVWLTCTSDFVWLISFQYRWFLIYVSQFP